MYKKISKNEKITRNISDVHSADNYLTRETTESVSVAVTINVPAFGVIKDN